MCDDIYNGRWYSTGSCMGMVKLRRSMKVCLCKNGRHQITDVNEEQMNELRDGLWMIMEQYPCRASKLVSNHPDKIKLAKVEAMYLVLGGTIE